MGAAELDAADAGVGKREIRCLVIRNVRCVSCSGIPVVWVGDAGDVTSNWDYLGRIPPQGGLQTEETETAEGTGWEVGLSSADGGDCGGGTT